MESFFDMSLDFVLRGLSFLQITAWVWVPLFLIAVLWRVWRNYLEIRTLTKMEWVLLEVRLPRDITRSPRAMELFLNALHNKGQIGDFVKRYWKGNLTPYATLEVFSIAGDVHFALRVERLQQRLIESQIYAQYPNAEIVEIEDYTNFPYDEDKHSMWIGEFVLTRPDPYPIATYVDYGLDKDPKEEVKNDPISPMMEWLGSLGAGEQGWIQIHARYHLDNRREKGSWFGSESSWKEDAKKEVEDIKEKARVKPEGDGGGTPRIELTPGQRETIEALERSTGKPGFDVGIRGAYIAEQDVFNPSNIGGLIGSFKSYGSGGFNGFKPDHTAAYTYPWQDPWGRREARNKRDLFEAYRRRDFFYLPLHRKPFVLNSEELATIYHFPGSTVATPTFKRIGSRKAEPPTDLPF